MIVLPRKKTINKNGYSIKMLANNDAEINMYGEVVSTHPIDWWTDEPAAGNFIAVDDFLKDLDSLKTKDNITVHINSVGGELYAGVSIYNRLKELPANIITVNDALAASAASIIFQAGDVRKVHSSSTVMVHQAAGFFYGYYQINDLVPEINSLESGNKQAINIYAEASGRSVEEMKELVDAETWLVGQEVIDAGLADELITDDEEDDINMCITPDKRYIISNNVCLPTTGMHNIPDTLKVSKYVPKMASKAKGKNNTEGSKAKMEIKTIEDLQNAFPEFVNQIKESAKAEGHAEGVTAERARIQGIEAIENAVADKDMLKDAKFGEATMTAEQLAFAAMQKQAAVNNAVAKAIDDDALASGVGAVTPEPAQTPVNVEPSSDDAALEMAVKMMNGGK